MVKIIEGLQQSQPAKYTIQIQGRQKVAWSDWMADLEINTDRNANGPTITTLSGIVQDQSGLHGMLNRIRDLNIPLISVQFIQTIILEKE